MPATPAPNPVRRGDWENLQPIASPRPLPAPRRVWNDVEMERIRRGLRPGSMEEKWFAFMEADVLHLHRSWTGAEIFRARFERHLDGWAMGEVEVCSDCEISWWPTDAEKRSGLEGLVATKLASSGFREPVIGRPSLIKVVRADITLERTDAIANAANRTLLGGGGVDGAIHRAAGPELLDACRLLSGCDVGRAKVTAGFELHATWIVHTVGPVWQGGSDGEPDLLASCYRESMAAAEACGARSIAFPAISTGAFGYPSDLAAEVAVETVLATPTRLQEVRLVCFDAATEGDLQAAMTRWRSHGS